MIKTLFHKDHKITIRVNTNVMSIVNPNNEPHRMFLMVQKGEEKRNERVLLSEVSVTEDNLADSVALAEKLAFNYINQTTDPNGTEARQQLKALGFVEESGN